MGACHWFFSVVRGYRGYRSGACIRHTDPRANGVGRGRIGFLSSLLDHLVPVSPRAQTWLRQCKHCFRYGPGSGVWHTRWWNSDEPIWLAPGFSSSGNSQPVMAGALASLDAKNSDGFCLASRTPRARHVPDPGAAVSLGNMCRSFLCELLVVLSPDLATVLPRARTSFFPGRDGKDCGVGLFPDG